MQAQGKAVGELCKHIFRRDDLKVQGLGIKTTGMWHVGVSAWATRFLGKRSACVVDE